MSESEPWTIKRLLEWTTDFLKSSGSDSPRLDAEVLLAEAKGCQRIELYTSYDQVPPEDQLARFREWIKQRSQGKPVAYLVGHREFYSLSFRVNEHVLIPRPETELLVTSAIDILAGKKTEPVQVCDIGTGSGCIAVSIAKNSPNAHVTAVDRSADAVTIAKENVKVHGVEDKVVVLQSDLLDDVQQPEQFDLIVSNPPYIGRQEKDSLAVDVKDHEPEMALYGGEKGTELISRMVESIVGRIAPGGRLLFETSPVIVDQCVSIVSAIPEYAEIEVLADLSKLPRVVSAVRQ